MNHMTRDYGKCQRHGTPWYTDENVSALKRYRAHNPSIYELALLLKDENVCPYRVHVRHGNRPTDTCFAYYWPAGQCWFVQSYLTIVRAVLCAPLGNAKDVSLIFDTWGGRSRTTSRHMSVTLYGIDLGQTFYFDDPVSLEAVVEEARRLMNERIELAKRA